MPRNGWYQLVLSIFSCVLLADEAYRPQNERQLRLAHHIRGSVNSDNLVRIQGAEVAWADFGLLRRDFPELRSHTDVEIRQWILDNFARISPTQLGLNGIRHTDIPVVHSDTRLGFRPQLDDGLNWNRAAVIEATTGGMVDVKGVGFPDNLSIRVMNQITTFNNIMRMSAEPSLINMRLDSLRTQDHSDGVMTLGEAIGEVTRQHAVQRLFDLHNATHGTHFQTVESYFIISLPSDVLRTNGERIPMTIYGRQAHIGRGNQLAIPSGTYSDAYGMRQRTFSDAAVDFGSVIITDPRLRHNFGFPLGYDGNQDNPQRSRPWMWGHETARAFRNGHHNAIERHLREMLAPIQQEWEALPIVQQRRAFQHPLPPMSRQDWQYELDLGIARRYIAQNFFNETSGLSVYMINPAIANVLSMWGNGRHPIDFEILKGLLSYGRLSTAIEPTDWPRVWPRLIDKVLAAATNAASENLVLSGSVSQPIRNVIEHLLKRHFDQSIEHFLSKRNLPPWINELVKNHMARVRGELNNVGAWCPSALTSMAGAL